MHSKRRYKICICLVDPRATWVFSKLQWGLEDHFSEKFVCNLTHYESALCITFLNSKILGFLFYKKSRFIAWGEKLRKITLQKMVGNLLDRLRKLYMLEGNGHLEIFSGPEVIDNSRQYLHLWTDILQKTIVGCSDCCDYKLRVCSCSIALKYRNAQISAWNSFKFLNPA